MSTVIQIRSVPEEIHRQVVDRAALEGLTISDFLLREIRKALAKPPRAELLARLAAYPKVDGIGSRAAELIREARDAE
jgi:hypothetical protein